MITLLTILFFYASSAQDDRRYEDNVGIDSAVTGKPKLDFCTISEMSVLGFESGGMVVMRTKSLQLGYFIQGNKNNFFHGLYAYKAIRVENNSSWGISLKMGEYNFEYLSISPYLEYNRSINDFSRIKIGTGIVRSLPDIYISFAFNLSKK